MAEIEHDIDALDEKLQAAVDALKNLDNGHLESVLELIRLPGWTSSAEYVFTIGLAQNLVDVLTAARGLQDTLLAGARRVSTP